VKEKKKRKREKFNREKREVELKEKSHAMSVCYGWWLKINP
jgi:hypothetical protein